MHKRLLIFAYIICFILGIYGINWGLPSRWCPEETVARVLHMLSDKTIVARGSFYHPTFHYFVLMLFFIPVLLFLKITGYPLDIVQKASSVSWIHLSIVDPAFSTLIYITARLSSVLFAVFVIYLTYRIAKECYSEVAGVYSAFFLSVSMGFISEAHIAKSTLLLIFLVMLTILACINYYKKRTIKKYIVPFFLGGLSLATKYNGGILIFPLGYYLFKVLSREKQFTKFYIPLLAFIFGFLIGCPGIITNFSDYINATTYFKSNYVPQSLASILSIFISGLLGYLLILKDIFGIPLFSVIILGIIFSLIKIKLNMPIKIILFTIIPYYIIFSLSQTFIAVKYIILIVPFLVVLSSGVISRLADISTYYRRTLFFILSIVWLLSLKYTLDCNKVYAYKDIRYEVTDWIESNIRKDQKIIIVGLSEYVIHNRLFKDYDITLLFNPKEAFSPKYNRHFVGGRQYPLSKENADKIIEDLNREHNYFIIYHKFMKLDRKYIWKISEVVESHGINIHTQKIIREFSRKTNSILGNFGICIYEPEKIVISYGIK